MTNGEERTRFRCEEMNQRILERARIDFSEEIELGLMTISLREAGIKKNLPGTMNDDFEVYGRIHLHSLEDTKNYGEIDFGSSWSNLKSSYLFFIVPWSKFSGRFSGYLGSAGGEYSIDTLLNNVRREWREMSHPISNVESHAGVGIGRKSGCALTAISGFALLSLIVIGGVTAL